MRNVWAERERGGDDENGFCVLGLVSRGELLTFYKRSAFLTYLFYPSVTLDSVGPT